MLLCLLLLRKQTEATRRRSFLEADRSTTAVVGAASVSLSIRDISQSSTRFARCGRRRFTHGSIHDTSVTITIAVAAGFGHIATFTIGRTDDVFIVGAKTAKDLLVIRCKHDTVGDCLWLIDCLTICFDVYFLEENENYVNDFECCNRE